MPIQIGERLPDVPLTLATPEGPIPVKSGDYFSGAGYHELQTNTTQKVSANSAARQPLQD